MLNVSGETAGLRQRARVAAGASKANTHGVSYRSLTNCPW